MNVCQINLIGMSQSGRPRFELACNSSVSYSVSRKVNFSPKDLKAIDKFALHKLNQLVIQVTEAFNNYEFYKYFQHLQNFAAVDLSSFYLDIVKDRLYTAGKKSLSRRACQTVLYEISQTLVRLLVPVMPHQAEDIWMSVPQAQKGGLESILLSDWPKANEKWTNNEIEADFEKILNIAKP